MLVGRLLIGEPGGVLLGVVCAYGGICSRLGHEPEELLGAYPGVRHGRDDAIHPAGDPCRDRGARNFHRPEPAHHHFAKRVADVEREQQLQGASPDLEERGEHRCAANCCRHSATDQPGFGGRADSPNGRRQLAQRPKHGLDAGSNEQEAAEREAKHVEERDGRMIPAKLGKAAQELGELRDQRREDRQQLRADDDVEVLEGSAGVFELLWQGLVEQRLCLVHAERVLRHFSLRMDALGGLRLCGNAKGLRRGDGDARRGDELLKSDGLRFRVVRIFPLVEPPRVLRHVGHDEWDHLLDPRGRIFGKQHRVAEAARLDVLHQGAVARGD